MTSDQYFSIYGTKYIHLETGKATLEELFDIEMEGRVCEEYVYYRYAFDSEGNNSLKIRQNFEGYDDVDDEFYWGEPDYKKFGLILYVVHSKAENSYLDTLNETNGFFLLERKQMAN